MGKEVEVLNSGALIIRHRRFWMGIGTFLSAFVVVNIEHSLLAWLSTRSSLLPAALVVLLAALIASLLRRFLVITLCFTVSMLTLRDTFLVPYMPVPQYLAYSWTHTVWEIVLLGISLLSLLAGLLELQTPLSLGARRCYFGAASAYFLWQALLMFASYGSIRSVFFAIAGLIALMGAIFAHKFHETDEPYAASQEEDVQKQKELDEAHRKKLVSNEWKESALGVCGEEKTNGINSASSH